MSKRTHNMHEHTEKLERPNSSYRCHVSRVTITITCRKRGERRNVASHVLRLHASPSCNPATRDGLLASILRRLILSGRARRRAAA